ncbi:MAG TPA: hypothetical protein VFI65_09180 [Streptosporangiaceae bacterium]|nr:hypothetical protein [Streptosporangiaceae bacterium]
MDELILRSYVILFDGRIVEIFRNPAADAWRQHIAFMKEPEFLGSDRKGRTLVKVDGGLLRVDADEMVLLRPFLDKITAAIRAASANRQPRR